MGKKFLLWTAPVLIPVVVLLILVMAVVNVAASNNDQVAATMQNENQDLDPNDMEFGEGDYPGQILTGGQIPVVYYSQYDSRWASIPYGTTGTVGRSGCGPSSMAIVISSLAGIDADPVFMKLWSEEHGYRVEGAGSSRWLIPKSAQAFGLTVEECQAYESDRIRTALLSGKLIVVIMTRGHFTSGGHFIVLRGITPEGKILVADPASFRRTNIAWDLSIITSEASKNKYNTGPFWIIGRI